MCRGASGTVRGFIPAFPQECGRGRPYVRLGAIDHLLLPQPAT
jgi:hypothetical protein